MKKCPKCGFEVADDKKFCGGCGYKFEQKDSFMNESAKCPKCGNPLTPGKKFCGACGTKIDNTETDSKSAKGSEDDYYISITSGHIQWNILPGQVALKITESDIDSYGKVTGVNIQDGIKALFFVGGKYVAELESGSYKFKNIGVDSKSFFERIANFFTGVNKQNAENAGIHTKKCAAITIVLVREVEFPLVFEFKNTRVGLLTCDVGLHLMTKITNLNEFYKAHLLDSKFVSYVFMEQLLSSIVARVFLEIDFSSDDFLKRADELKNAVNKNLEVLYPYITVSKVIDFGAGSEALSRISQLKEELYIAELELEQLTKRNHYLNKLNSETNRQQLRQAQSQADFRAAMDKIDQQNMLTDDEKDKFALMLESQRLIRQAQSQEEVDTALGEIRKTGLLREEELSVLQNQINYRAELQNLSDTQQIALATIQNQKILDKEKLDWEMQIGNVRFENQLNREKLQAETEIEIQHKKQESKLDILRQAQALRMERENAEHQRTAELKKMELDAYAGMSVEQIMAINPNISPEAAKALGEKFKSESLQSQVDMANQQKNEMREFMQQEMAVMREMVRGSREETQNHEDRYTDVMKTTIKAVAGANGIQSSIIKCQKCGAENAAGTKFCMECGEGV